MQEAHFLLHSQNNIVTQARVLKAAVHFGSVWACHGANEGLSCQISRQDSNRPAKTNAERKRKRDRERKRMGLVSRARKSAKLYEPTTIFATTRLQRGCFTRRDAPRQTPCFQNDPSLRYETREKRSRLSAMQISLRHRSYIIASTLVMHPHAVTRWSTATRSDILED